MLPFGRSAWLARFALRCPTFYSRRLYRAPAWASPKELLLPFVNRERTIDRMLFAFNCNTPQGLSDRGEKSTVPIAGQGLGEGKTFLGKNLQSYVKEHMADFEKYRDIRDSLVAAYYLRVELNGTLL